MRIGIIGTGNVGLSLGNAFVRAGHEVVYGSRDDGRTAPHAGAILGTIAGAVMDSEMVVLATPFEAIEAALGAAGDFQGKVLVDATNPIDGSFELTIARTSSGAEEIATIAKNARVVKCFNTTSYEVMANPRFGAHRALMPVCGDDDDAVKKATALATDVGFEAIALPGLARARDLEAFALVWIQLAVRGGLGRNVAVGLARRDNAGPSADETVNLTALPGALSEGTTKNVTVVGAGSIGGGLARAWIRAGHDVRLAVRDPLAPDVVDLVEQGAKAIPIEGAGRDTDAVVIAVPAAAVPDVLKRMGDLSGTILVDATNGIGPGLVMSAAPGTSSPEQMAALANGARVVRAFNQQGAETLRDARFGELRAMSLIASDDQAARDTVRALANDIGFDAIDAGPLSSSRVIDHLTLVWLALSRAVASREIALTLLRR